MGMLEDKLFNAIGRDDLDTVKTILDQDKSNINIKNDLKWTILHACAFHGSEKVFDFILPQLKKARLNMFDKHKETPFAKAVVGPSEKIFKALLTHPDIELEKCEDKDTYGGSTRRRYEPIFKLISKPEFSSRVSMYFDTYSTPKVSWASWYSYAAWQGVKWAVKLVLDNGEYDGFADYTQRGGMSGAITFDRKEVIEMIYKHDSHVFEPSNFAQSPLAAGLKTQGRFEYLISLLPPKLNKTKSGGPYDALIDEIRRYKPEIALKHFQDLMAKDIFISEKKIREMLNDQMNDVVFFQSSTLRSDYEELFMPIILESGRFERYLPQTAKDVFLF